MTQFRPNKAEYLKFNTLKSIAIVKEHTQTHIWDLFVSFVKCINLPKHNTSNRQIKNQIGSLYAQ